MKPLAALFRERVAFDEPRAKDDCKRRIEAFGKDADLFQLHIESARFEHHYRKPIDEAVARVIEAADKHFMACKPKTKYDLTELSAFADLYEALTALRKALE